MSLAACAAPLPMVARSSWARIDKVIIAPPPVSLSPRAGRGWGEGASPLGAELRRSESRRGPLTLAHFVRSTSPRTRGEVIKSRRGLRLEIRMHDGAVAGQRCRLDDVIVPVDRKRLGLLVDQNFQKRVEVLGIEVRCRGGEPARHVAIADDFDAVLLAHRIC